MHVRETHREGRTNPTLGDAFIYVVSRDNNQSLFIPLGWSASELEDKRMFTRAKRVLDTGGRRGPSAGHLDG